MADRRLLILGATARKLDFVVERLQDGAFYDPKRRTWRKPHGRASYAPMIPLSGGRYEAQLPDLTLDQEYCVHVIDTTTQQLVLSQLIDGEANKLATSRVSRRKDRSTPRNEYHGGFVMDVRPGRAIELE